ncbi:unnamed protein product, partial [Polarella glacialis]
EFSRTAAACKFERPATSAGLATARAPDIPRERDEDSSDDEVPSPHPSAVPAGQESSARTTAGLQNAGQKVAKVNEEILRAQDLMSSIEGALDQRDSEIQLRRSAEAEKRSALERE